MDSYNTLTPREQEVLALVAQGMRNRDIASALFVTEKTIETHLRHIYRKLYVRSRTAAARHFWAHQYT